MSDKYINTNYSLSTICDFNKYNLSKKDNFINIEYLDTSNITENNINKLIIYDIKHAPSRAKRKVKDKTIIYSTVRPIQKHFGILKNPKDNMIVSTGFITIDLKKEFIHIIDEYYIYYLITQNSITEYLQTIAEGSVSAYPSITSDDIINLRFSFPKIEYQKQIANYLLQIDKKIQLNNLIYSELEKMAKTLYDYWFVQFDFPDENGRPYKSSGGKMVWSEELQREIPYGWEVKNIVDNPFTSLISVGIEYFNSKNYLATKNINGEIISDGEFITYENRETRANMQPQINSIWFAKMQNSIKHITLPNNSQWFVDKYILSTGFFGLKCQKDALSYIHCFINSKYFENKKDTLAHGATQKAVNASDIENILLLIPTLDILKQFNDKVYSLLEMKLEIIKQNQELTSLRDFLLPLLINGQAVIKE